MYEAPDRYKRMIAARLPDGESLGLATDQDDTASTPLKDVQLISRAQLAPFFAAANIFAAVMRIAVLWGEPGPMLLLPWALAVFGINLLAMQIARTQSITNVGRSGKNVPDWLMICDVVTRAIVWLSLPLYLFPTLPPGAQVISASISSGLGIAGLGLVVLPRSAIGWMSAFTAGLCGAMFIGRNTVPFQHMLSILFTLGVSIFGVLNVARWAFEQLKTNANFSAQSESASLLLQEYEQRGFVPPNVFIPVAEEAGLMVQIGEWVIEEACRAAASWPEPITVALNISPKQILQPALPNVVSEALARFKVPGNRLELEVTEGVFLGDNGQTVDVLGRLRALGVGIALDDFGTGYSSIGYLNKAIFHKLKIDGSFVREAGSRPENVAIIKSIVQLAKSFRMSVTAEGVETAEDFERMRELGCDTIQGYLFGKPLSYERANQMVLGLGAKRMAG